MAHYMVQASYAQEALQRLVANPGPGGTAMKQAAEKFGGKVEATYFTFGDYDILVILQLPDHITIAQAVMGVRARGGVTRLKTTVLIPPEDAVEGMKRAASLVGLSSDSEG